MGKNYSFNNCEYLDSIAVLIPAYKPNYLLIQLAKELISDGVINIIVVDDGSGAEYKQLFDELETLGILVVHHATNLGKGAALKTGISFINEHFSYLDGIVTADADGQHKVQDILSVIQATGQNKNALVLGARDLEGSFVPWKSKAGNRITALVFQLTTGTKCSDTQTGLRGFSRQLFSLLIQTAGERYDYEMNVLYAAVESGIQLHIVPISTVYIDDNSSSHFRVVKDSMLIYKKPLKLLLAMIISAVCDLALFYLLFSVLFGGAHNRIMGSTVIARLLSASIFYVLKHILKCRVRRSNWKERTIYTLLFFACMLLSGICVSQIARSGAPILLSKIVTDILLFIIASMIKVGSSWNIPVSK